MGSPEQPTERSPDELLEAYLDGQLADDELQRAERLIASDPAAADVAELQQRIDASLRRTFTADAPADLLAFLNKDGLGNGELRQGTLQQRESQPSHGREEPPSPEPNRLAASNDGSSKPTSRRRLMQVAIGLAAAVAWVAVFGQLFWPEERGSYARRSLTSVYTECVDRGFEPDWVCEDEVVFAKTFSDRQGTPLRLAELPTGRRMVGLSYLDGLTPKATSMLAEVDGEPVIVFVAKLSEDPRAKTGPNTDSGVNVIRTERLGLVFYEVTPFDEPLVAPYFEIASKD